MLLRRRAFLVGVLGLHAAARAGSLPSRSPERPAGDPEIAGPIPDHGADLRAFEVALVRLTEDDGLDPELAALGRGPWTGARWAWGESLRLGRGETWLFPLDGGRQLCLTASPLRSGAAEARIVVFAAGRLALETTLHLWSGKPFVLRAAKRQLVMVTLRGPEPSR